MRGLDLRAAAVAMAVLAVAACSIETTRTVKVDLPAAAQLRLDETAEIVVAAFKPNKEPEGFDLGRALTDYFRDELRSVFKGKVTAAAVSWDEAKPLENAEAWKRALPDPRRRTVLAGTAEFTEDRRKALLSQERRAIDDGPFTAEKMWAERKAYALKLSLVVVKPETGEVLIRSDFQETMMFENQKQTAEFAFYEIIPRVRAKLFRQLFGAAKSQDRILLLR